MTASSLLCTWRLARQGLGVDRMARLMWRACWERVRLHACLLHRRYAALRLPPSHASITCDASCRFWLHLLACSPRAVRRAHLRCSLSRLPAALLFAAAAAALAAAWLGGFVRSRHLALIAHQGWAGLQEARLARPRPTRRVDGTCSRVRGASGALAGLALVRSWKACNGACACTRQLRLRVPGLPRCNATSLQQPGHPRCLTRPAVSTSLLSTFCTG